VNHRQAVYFLAPRQVEVRQEDLPRLEPGQVLVESLVSAISPGTEMLVYRGQFPQGMSADATISALSDEFSYPLKYGYSLVGRVVEIAGDVDPGWRDRLVFAFQPHQSHFQAAPSELIPVPEGLTPEQAVFLPNMETAVNFVMDGKPLVGERVAVVGQGIVGLLTTAVLSCFPLETLVTFDRFALRRRASLQLEAHASLDPEDGAMAQQLKDLLPAGADLTYELSGAPEALDLAIAATGFDGRVIIGSWYGQKRASPDLGGRFHRSRIRLVSSQVSTIAPEFSGRWSKERRFAVAWQMLREVNPQRCITHRFPIQRAAEAYQWVDQHPGETIQVLLDYNSSSSS
jgi:2-desacetyl-2-hydroxyethyl bacteriochlorophyllide A dehydrogenase